jgi:hypothetical protein
MSNCYRCVIVAAVLLGLAAASGCGGRDHGSEMPARDIKTVLETHAEALMAIDGVTAVAIGVLDDGTPCIKVYVQRSTDELTKRIPDNLDGHPVRVEESGSFRPMSDEGG